MVSRLKPTRLHVAFLVIAYYGLSAVFRHPPPAASPYDQPLGRYFWVYGYYIIYSIHTTSFYETIMGHIPPQTGSVSWGVTTHKSYLPSNNDAFFQKKMSLVDWLRQYTEKEEERDEKFLRGFLGKMLFSGDEALKDCDILSGGEKVRRVSSRTQAVKAFHPFHT